MIEMTDAELDRLWNIAVRDDWHRELVGSDIRVLIREIQNMRARLPAQQMPDPFMDNYKRDTIKDLIERCALIVEAECERMLSKQYPASKTGMEFTDTINTNIRMMACHLPNIAASIRALSFPSTERCILCANGNDLPEGERCAGCGREGEGIHHER